MKNDLKTGLQNMHSLPVRVFIGVMVFTGCWQNYMLRVNMSINIVAMVKHKPNPKNETSQECGPSQLETNETVDINPDYGTRYEWNSVIEGHILGAYYYGYILTSFPGGFFAERFGPRLVVAVSTILSSVFTFVTPFAAALHYGILILLRFLLGACAGIVYPSMHCLISKWAPTHEKGKFLGALMGGTFGTVVTWPLCGFIIQNLGWGYAFYFTGILSFVWCLLWIVIVSDSPDCHSRISDYEKEYIVTNLQHNVQYNSNKKRLPPYCKIFTSMPFFALLILHFGNLWGLYFLMNSGPKFMSEVLGYKLLTSGVLSSLPYLLRMSMGIVFGLFGDYIRKNEILSVTAARKLFCLTSHVLPGIFLYCMLFTGCNTVIPVILMMVSLGFNGSATITNLMNSQDLAPNFAGTLYGIINSIGSTTGFLCPALVGYLTKKQSTFKEWHIIIGIGGCLYIVPAIIFVIFGSGNVQKWNTANENEEKKRET